MHTREIEINASRYCDHLLVIINTQVTQIVFIETQCTWSGFILAGPFTQKYGKGFRQWGGHPICNCVIQSRVVLWNFLMFSETGRVSQTPVRHGKIYPCNSICLNIVNSIVDPLQSRKTCKTTFLAFHHQRVISYTQYKLWRWCPKYIVYQYDSTIPISSRLREDNGSARSLNATNNTFQVARILWRREQLISDRYHGNESIWIVVYFPLYTVYAIRRFIIGKSPYLTKTVFTAKPLITLFDAAWLNLTDSFSA